jgi:hypothetical protein
VTGTTICSPQLHLYVRILRAEVGSTNEYSSDVALPHARQFGGWLLSESSPDIVMRLCLPNSTFLFGTVSDICRALKPVTSGNAGTPCCQMSTAGCRRYCREMGATSKPGLNEEKAARMMVALREGRTLRKFGVKAPRLEAFLATHTEYAQEALPLIEINKKLAFKRKGIVFAQWRTACTVIQRAILGQYSSSVRLPMNRLKGQHRDRGRGGLPPTRCPCVWRLQSCRGYARR